MQLDAKNRHGKVLPINGKRLESKYLARKIKKRIVCTDFDIPDFNAMDKYCKEHRIKYPQDLIRMLVASHLKKNDYL